MKHVNAPYFNSVYVPMFTGHILGTPGSQIVDECDEAAPWARHLYSSYYLAAADANTDGDRGSGYMNYC